MAIVVKYRRGELNAGHIEVGDGSGATISWSPDMWEECVWSRVAAGKLPALARHIDDDPVPVGALARIPDWRGTAVIWDASLFGEGRLEVGAEDWRTFVDQIIEGSLSVEALQGTDPGKDLS